MTAVRLSDVIQSQLWTPAFVLADPVLTNFFQSGIAVLDPLMDQFAHSESGTIAIRWLKPLDGSIAENQSNDDPASLSTPQGTSTGVQAAVKLFRNQSWASMDLTAALFSPDPVAAIRTQVATYWLHRYQAYIVSVCAGITLANIANSSGDMVFDATGASGAAAMMSLDNVLQAKQTMGDTAGALGVIAMHSVVHTNLQRQQLIATIPSGQANITIQTFGGYRVVVDDGMPVVSDGSGGFNYTSYMYAPGFIRWGTGTPKVPTETKRTPDAGNGEGEETFYNRQHWVGHPTGFNYAANTAGVPTFNPTNTVLATAAAWNRVWARKQVPFVAVKTKG
jgi:hypothetical protein